MAISREKKSKILENIQDKVKKQKSMVFIDFTGVKVKDLSDFRKKLKAGGSELKVIKKSLLRLALDKAGIEVDVKNLKGEVAAIFGLKDEVAPAKAANDFMQENPNVKILGGILENKASNVEQMIALAKLPSRDQLLAQTVGSIGAPLSGFVNVLQGNISGLVRVLSQIKSN